MWWPTCNYNTCTRGRRASFLILLMMGAWRPKHVEWLCRNKTCTLLHQVGILFDLKGDTFSYQWVPGKEQSVRAAYRLIHLLPRLRLSESLSVIPHKHSWHGALLQGQFCLTFWVMAPYSLVAGYQCWGNLLLHVLGLTFKLCSYVPPKFGIHLSDCMLSSLSLRHTCCEYLPYPPLFYCFSKVTGVSWRVIALSLVVSVRKRLSW